VGIAALAMSGASVARADSAPDPLSKIVVPTDPSAIVPCGEESEGVVCFTETNSISNPEDIAGPSAAEIASDPLFDIVTDFFYEPDNCGSSNPSSCPASDILDQVYLAIVPTIPSTAYPCYIGAGPGEATPAFNGCSPIGVTPDSDVILELVCSPTPNSPCTGMLPGQEGSAEVTPEPGELALLGIGLPLVGFYGWKRRNVLALARGNQATLAAS
jgi:hypothetical protein